MSYRKQISYLELQENGQRVQSAGHARWESRDNEEILTVQINGIRSAADSLELRLQTENGEEVLGEIVINRGQGQCEKRFHREDGAQIQGIRIPVGPHMEIIGRFAGAKRMQSVANEAHTGVTAASRPEQMQNLTVGPETMQASGRIARPEVERQSEPETTLGRQSALHGKNVQQSENVSREDWMSERNSPLPDNSVSQSEVTAQAEPARQSEVSAQTELAGQSEVSAQAEPAGQSESSNRSSARASENTLHMKDTKWEQLSSIYPHIHPFHDAREFLSVGPEDFVVLRERCYQMTHNSFLLHGYYNYRHLLLMRQETTGQVKYYLGVPGNFYEREKQVARMFGFESFEGTREPAWEGDFGYYLIAVEL